MDGACFVRTLKEMPDARLNALHSLVDEMIRARRQEALINSIAESSFAGCDTADPCYAGCDTADPCYADAAPTLQERDERRCGDDPDVGDEVRWDSAKYGERLTGTIIEVLDEDRIIYRVRRNDNGKVFRLTENEFINP